MGISHAFFGATLLITRALARDNPALLDERMKPFIQEGQPLWDKLILASLVVLFAFWLILMGLDAGRFRWSAMPALLQWLGAAGVLISMGIISRVFRVNTFLANVVRIQTERGHEVVASGPYGIVRHPLYAAALLLLPSIALMLGTWFGLIATLLLASTLILRTALEDRELQARLDGYRTTQSASATG
jgi:protein-S-isoprenylcysteine O-methyltransferase Ste14